MKKDVSKQGIIFGVKKAGVTWLYRFNPPEMFNQAKAGAEKLGLSLSQLLCGEHRRLPAQRKFTVEDQKTSTLKIQIIECDEFTRKCLERQAAYDGFGSIEEYIADAALTVLECDEEDAFLDPGTGEVALTGCLLGQYIGCKVDKDAPNPPPSGFRRIRIPAGTIIETYD